MAQALPPPKPPSPPCKPKWKTCVFAPKKPKNACCTPTPSFRTSAAAKTSSIRPRLKHATSDFIKNLLPVLDNFERALKAAEQTKNYDALVGGVNGTLKQLTSALQKAGVTPIEAVGKEFDPNYHEAIGHAESSEHPANTVAEEVQRGYLMHDRVLRPTLVKVSQG